MSDKPQEIIVYVVDDDEAVRNSLGLLLTSAGRTNQTFESATEFLVAYRPEKIGCLVADIRMPGMSGLELQQELTKRRMEIPIIFITGHGDVPMAVTAMKAGALDFLTKPFRDHELLERIDRALSKATREHRGQLEDAAIQARYDTLTPREAEVMALVVKGHANKVIAMDLGVSQRTVELHRARVMHKMAVRSLAELVLLSERVG